MKRDARLDAMLQQAQQKQRAALAAEKAKIEEFVASGEAPFFNDVLAEVAALSRLEDESGHELSLKDLYERACWANPDVRALLLQRAVSEAKISVMKEFTAVLKKMPMNRRKKKR